MTKSATRTRSAVQKAGSGLGIGKWITTELWTMKVSSTKNMAISSRCVGNEKRALAGKIWSSETVTLSDIFHWHTELTRSSHFYLLHFYLLLSSLQKDEVLPFFDSGDWFINTLFPITPFFSSCVEAEVYCSCLISQMTTKVVKSLNTRVSTLQAGNMRSTYLSEFLVLSRGLIIWLDEDDGSEKDFLRIPKWL